MRTELRGDGVLTAGRTIPAPPDRVFGAATDWPAQSRWIPFTRVRVAAGDGRSAGSVVEATTLGVLDVIRIVRYDPPHAVEVVHTGRWLRGPGAFTFDAVPGGTRFTVHEWFHLPGGWAGRLAWAAARPVLEFAARRSLATFARLLA